MPDIINRNLLPCPFCGSTAEWEYTPWNEEDRSGDDGSGWVECTGCHIQMPCGCRDEAEERWNKRHQPDQDDQEASKYLTPAERAEAQDAMNMLARARLDKIAGREDTE